MLESTELIDNGFVVHNHFLDKKVVDDLKKIYSLHSNYVHDAFYTSHWIKSIEIRKKISHDINNLLSNSFKDFSNDYRFIYHYFLVKKPSEYNYVHLHQDWTLIDESKFNGYTFWIPLDDTNESNGCFRVLPGSHNIFKNIRGNNIEMPYAKIEGYIEETHMISLPAKAGDAIIFNHKLIHSSYPNYSQKERVAVGIVAVPKESQLIHFELKNKNLYRKEVADDFLINYGFKEEFSPCSNDLIDDNFSTVSYSVDFFNELLRICKRPIFKDKALENEILDRGFIKAKLLNKTEVDVCLKIFEESEKYVDSTKYNSLEINSYEYRKLVYDKLSKVVGTKVLDLFHSYRIFGYNFVVKKASTHIKFEAHIDDIHADENKYTAYNVWIPLVDVDDKNGGLYVVSQSHKINLPIRGIGLPFPFEKHKQMIDSKAKEIRMKAGEALIFHSKIIHGSKENFSGFDRPAIVLGLIPKESQCVIYVNFGDWNNIEKYEVNDDFFLSFEIGKRPEFLNCVEKIEYKKFEYLDSEIENLLD
jgi:ectoine hydroxylase-related dioxygenase (phytanoyl-CoA dioxygenase family)